ncbi:MAG: MDR family oxidoreductase [Chloroflexota bacterium]
MTQPQVFKGLLLDDDNGVVRPQIRDVTTDALPAGDVLVRVEYSALNYKDGLAITGKGKIVRSYPMVPGIDLVGTVVESDSSYWKPGDQVIHTGWGVGENHWGGLAQMARLQGHWLVPLPAGMTALQAMALGSAGFTAMIAVMALEDHGLEPARGEVVVTGAAGGLGSASVAILARSGYTVVASTGRPESHEYLTSLGAAEIIKREVLAESSSRPLQSGRWAGAIDAVGGSTLAGLLRTMAERSSIAVCGNTAGHELHTTVFPFILRGVTMIGIESARVPLTLRRQAWERLARDLPAQVLDRMTQVVGLDDVQRLSGEIVEGKVLGRVVVDVQHTDL